MKYLSKLNVRRLQQMFSNMNLIKTLLKKTHARFALKLA